MPHRRRRSPGSHSSCMHPPSRIARASGTPGPSCSAGCSLTRSTATHAGEATAAIRVTHPFHPLFGQALDVVVHRHNWGEDRVYYRDGRGHLTSVPAGWTSVVPEDAFVAVAAGRSRFRVEDLVALAALVLRLRS